MNLSLEELKQRNAGSQPVEPIPQQPLQNAPSCPLTQEKLDNLFHNQGALWDGIEKLEKQQKILLQQLYSIKSQLNSLPTLAQLEQISKTLSQIQQIVSQAGKKKEKHFSLPKFRLPRLEWTVELTCLLWVLVALLLILFASVNLWNSLTTLHP